MFIWPSLTLSSYCRNRKQLIENKHNYKLGCCHNVKTLFIPQQERIDLPTESSHSVRRSVNAPSLQAWSALNQQKEALAGFPPGKEKEWPSGFRPAIGPPMCVGASECVGTSRSPSLSSTTYCAWRPRPSLPPYNTLEQQAWWSELVGHVSKVPASRITSSKLGLSETQLMFSFRPKWD